MPTREDSLKGGLLGLLIGDAVGVPYEFHPPSALPTRDLIDLVPPADFRRAHPRIPPGTWSDDGAQALCLLASLLAKGEMDSSDFGARLVRWSRKGYMAVDGVVFDVGIQTMEALQALASGVPPGHSGPNGERDNGNGSLMRVLPVALWHRGSDRELTRDAMCSSAPTHGHIRSLLCCALYCMWARRLLEGDELDAGWSRAVDVVSGIVAKNRTFVEELDVIEPLEEPVGRGSGYVVDCLHSARMVLRSAGSCEEAIRSAIALGDDTDTTAAVTGGIAGIVYGAGAIPERWVRALRGKELVDPLIEGLLRHHRRAAAGSSPGGPPDTAARHSVYVVELDEAVLEDRRFVEANPQYEKGMKCLYVGMTGLSPDERFANHKQGHKANKYVRDHGKYLRRRLYERHNPMPHAEAKEKEAELANRLRAKGHAVWQR